MSEFTDLLDGLHALSLDVVNAKNWLADNWPDDLPTPYWVGGRDIGRLMINVSCWDAETFARATRALVTGAPLGAIEKAVASYGNYSQVFRHFGKVSIELWINRDEVCERRQIGTEMVEVIDPNAPKVTVERPVYEWDCKPVLAGDQAEVQAL